MTSRGRAAMQAQSCPDGPRAACESVSEMGKPRLEGVGVGGDGGPVCIQGLVPGAARARRDGPRVPPRAARGQQSRRRGPRPIRGQDAAAVLGMPATCPVAPR